MPEWVSDKVELKTRLNSSKNKIQNTIFTSSKTVIIPKIVILKTRILSDLDQQPTQSS